MTQYIATVPNMLGLSNAAFNLHIEQATAYVNPAYVPEERETLPFRDHAQLRVYQALVNSEVQAFMIAATDQGSSNTLNTTTGAAGQVIVQISLADDECVELNASIDGKRTTGVPSHVFQRIHIKAVRVDAGAGLEVVTTIEDTGPEYDSNGLATAAFRIIPNPGNNSIDIVADPEAVNMTHTATYTVRRF